MQPISLVFECGSVKNASKFCAKVEVIGCAFAKIIQYFTTVHLDDVSMFVEERDNNRSVQMLMATGSQDAKLLKR